MKRCQRTFLLISALLLWGPGGASPALAQIIPDNSLSNPTVVERSGNLNRISGGTRADRNLFHSFEQFSLRSGDIASFNNADAIARIFARVTGGRASQINGLIQANGTADLFLLNPQGIVFGPNARLDVGGSFIASTADHLLFEDGTVFSAVNPQDAPLLTVSAPIGLGFGNRPGPIRNQARLSFTTPDGFPVLTGLQVPTGETLALLGGNVVFDGGVAVAPEGRVLLGSVRSPDTIRLRGDRIGYRARYGRVESFGNIRLTNLANVNANGLRGGSIQVDAANLILDEGSKITSSTFADQAGDDITIRATESVQVLGTTSIPGLFEPDPTFRGAIFSAILTDTFGAGDAGNILIDASRVVIADGARISANTLGLNQTGNGGNIVINASESFDIRGTAEVTGDPLFPFPNPPFPEEIAVKVNGSALLLTVSINQGSSGDITVNTPRLTLQDGGGIIPGTRGSGPGGNLVINADTVDVIGTSPDGVVNTSISSSTFPLLPGLAGEAGDVTINTRRLSVRDGANVGTQTFGPGQGGTLTINASESVEVSNSFLLDRSGVRVDAFNSGPAGALSINTPQLVLTNQGQIEVSSFGTGAAGNLNIRADSIRLVGRSSINGTTASGLGGNLVIQASDFLLMRDNSQISAQASGVGSGGNVTITTPTIAAVLNENSDILANAIAGSGGNISITASNIIGIVTTNGPLDDTLSEINASSATGIDGVVVITTPDIDPSRGTTELPEDLVDVAQLVGRSLCTEGQGSEFIATGRGGLPPSPHETLLSDGIWDDWYITDAAPQTQADSPSRSATPVAVSPESGQPEPTTPVVQEAQGWFINAQGQVVLAMTPSPSTAHGDNRPPTDCRSLHNALSHNSQGRSPATALRASTVSDQAVAAPPLMARPQRLAEEPS